MTDHRDWTGKVGTIWAREWQRTDRSFRELTGILLDRIGKTGFEKCIDIGCGAGEISIALAKSASQAMITGVDISPELLAVARQRSENRTNLDFTDGDAARYSPDEQGVDLLVSRHGVMFFPAPVEAFAHFRSISARDARLVFSCFRERERNEWVSETLSVLPTVPVPPPAGEPGPFAFGDRDHVARILDSAGWTDVAFEKIDYRMIFGGGDDPVEDACDYLSRVGPTATQLAALEDTERAEALDKLRKVLSGHLRDGFVALPAAAWIVTASAGD